MEDDELSEAKSDIGQLTMEECEGMQDLMDSSTEDKASQEEIKQPFDCSNFNVEHLGYPEALMIGTKIKSASCKKKIKIA